MRFSDRRMLRSDARPSFHAFLLDIFGDYQTARTIHFQNGWSWYAGI
jgi:hypothetical protein